MAYGTKAYGTAPYGGTIESSNKNSWKNIFKFKIIFDASGSHTNCEHDIVKYIWDFGDGTSKTTKETKVIHYYSKTGNYKFKMVAEASCPQKPPNIATIELEVHVKLRNLTILRFFIKKGMIIRTTVRIKIKDHFLFRSLNKEDIEKELASTKEIFGESPEEFYKSWQKGKYHGFQATKLAHLYEFYRSAYLRM